MLAMFLAVGCNDKKATNETIRNFASFIYYTEGHPFVASSEEKEAWGPINILHLKKWRTIKLGVGPKTVDGFRRELTAAGLKIGDEANDILNRTTFSAKETEVTLINCTLLDLGLKEGGTWEKIRNRAIELDIFPCPSEVGPQLALQYKDQPNDNWLHIAMEPIIDSKGAPRNFYVGHDGSYWLETNSGQTGSWNNEISDWVFCRPK